MRQITSLGYKEAHAAIEAIITEAQRLDKPVVAAVSDAYGELLALARMDGAPLPSTVIAANKAWTAARERKPSGDLGKASQDPQSGFDLRNFGDPRYIGFGGGIPVFMAGNVIGAVAVSGLAESEDEELSRIGITAIESLK
jgi:glc operon protein GlcG